MTGGSFDLIVVGGGVFGLSTVLEAGRRRRHTLPASLIVDASSVSNRTLAERAAGPYTPRPQGQVALAISHDSEKIRLLTDWNEERLSPGEVRKRLDATVWPAVTLVGLWGKSWSSFWASLARSVQAYAHFSPVRMRWHQHIQIVDGKWRVWINHPGGGFELYRAARIGAFELLVFWAFAELVCAFGAAPVEQLARLESLADQARQWLATNEVFFQGEKWEVQLMPFVYPAGAQYWNQR